MVTLAPLAGGVITCKLFRLRVLFGVEIRGTRFRLADPPAERSMPDGVITGAVVQLLMVAVAAVRELSQVPLLIDA